MSKKIKVNCHGPIALNRKYESPWEDVWLSWTDKPGRKKYYLALCLIGKKSTIQDYEMNLQLQKENPDLDYSNDIKILEQMLDMINQNEIGIDRSNKDLPNIYSPKDYINRDEAERMISELMKFHGYESIKFKWKRPKWVIIPM